VSVPPPQPDRRAGPRVSWMVGALMVLVIAYVTLNAARTEGPGSRGVPAGEVLPPFAMPLAASAREGDANVSRTGGSDGAGRVPACTVRGPDVLNSCALAERGPVVLAFLVTRGGSRCEDQLDRIEAVRARFPGVQFAAIAVRGDRGALRGLIRERGWGFPVGYDHDGLVANVYGVAVCPTLVFAYPGGRVMDSALGSLGERELIARVRALSTAARERGWTPPS